MPFNKKKIFNWIKVIIILYSIIGIVLFYTQEKFLLHPLKLSENHVFKFQQSFKEYNIPLNKEDNINLIRFLPVDDSVSKGAVIYFHGNTNNVESYASAINIFIDNGYEVWMPDYPSFGKSIGVINERSLYEMAFQIKRFANRFYNDSDIIIYGRSLGTGIAANLASSSAVKAVVLEAPYFSIPDLFSSYLPVYPMSAMSKYKLPTGEFLKDVSSPVIVFHGTNDDVIPLSCSEKLKPCLKPKDKFLVIKDAGHNDLNKSKIYESTILSLLN